MPPFELTDPGGAPARTTDAALAQLAAGQHGRVATWQLVQLGVTHRELRRRVDAGRLHREHVGVYAVGHPGRTPDAARMAAVLSVGPRGLLCHRALGHHLGLLDGAAPAQVDVMLPGGRRTSKPGVRLHQPRQVMCSEVTSVRGVPCTTVERLLADLAADATQAELDTAAHRAQVRRLVRPHCIEWQLARPTAGIDRLRTLIEPTGPDLRQRFERDFAGFARRGRWPPYEANVLLRTPLGQLRIDVLWRAHGFGIELDSWQFHGTRGSFESDRERDVAADLVGIHVARVTWRMLHGRPQVLERLLDHRLQRRRSS